MNKSLALTIRNFRRRAGKTQSEVSSVVGVGRAAYAKWELGQSRPTIPHLILLANYYGVTVDMLLNGGKRGNAC